MDGDELKNKVESTALVVLTPVLAWSVLGLATGRGHLGASELLVLLSAWAFGLTMVWLRD